jgi:hypothetical protein
MHYRELIVYILVFSIFNLCACSHTKSIRKQNIAKDYQPGNKVEIKIKTGARYEFILTEVTADSLKGNQYKIAIEDIQTIKKIGGNKLILVWVLVGIGLFVLIGKGLAGTIGPH